VGIQDESDGRPERDFGHHAAKISRHNSAIALFSFSECQWWVGMVKRLSATLRADGKRPSWKAARISAISLMGVGYATLSPSPHCCESEYSLSRSFVVATRTGR